jgi:hypothetical protein
MHGTRVGVSSLKEVGLSRGFSRFFCRVGPGWGRTLCAEAPGFFANVLVRTRGSSCRVRLTSAPVQQHGLFIGSGRSRSCPRDCTPIHPFVQPPALRQVFGRPGTRPPGTVWFCATILRSQARPNQSDVPRDRSRGIHETPRTERGAQGSWRTPRPMQSPLRCLLRVAYHRVTQGTSIPNSGHNSSAAACRPTARTAAHSSKAWPRDPQTKHW